MQVGNQELYHSVRGALIAKGTNLTRWCAENGLTRAWVTLALKGERKGEAAKGVLKQVCDFAGVNRD